jgi:hypothetical protein
MDPIANPYSPGAGSPPPELAGRDKLREQVRIGLARIRRGHPSKCVLMIGLRRVGKNLPPGSDAQRRGNRMSFGVRVCVILQSGNWIIDKSQLRSSELG